MKKGTASSCPNAWNAVSEENPEFLTTQILTYLGNKRSLLPFIDRAVRTVKEQIGRKRMSFLDVFSGTGIVSRLFKQHAERLYVNDLEAYSRCVNTCYLSNRSDVDIPVLAAMMEEVKAEVEANLHPGLISGLYAPQDDQHIEPGERVFYTVRNAQYIDTARERIETLPENMKVYFLAPLLYGASVHNNTAGVFKGFYKNREGIGQYGGQRRDALPRILGDITLQMPVFSRFDCDVEVFQKDALDAVNEMPEDVDMAYLDPPYNEHPYGSNYFMLNLILDYRRPDALSRVAGIPEGWNHSAYNRRAAAQQELFRLIENLRARYMLISYNSEGLVKYGDFVDFLSRLGELKTVAINYNTFRGCRNLHKRDAHVTEHLFLLKRS